MFAGETLPTQTAQVPHYKGFFCLLPAWAPALPLAGAAVRTVPLGGSTARTAPWKEVLTVQIRRVESVLKIFFFFKSETKQQTYNNDSSNCNNR